MQEKIKELEAIIKATNLYAKITNVLYCGIGEGPEAQAIRDEADRPWLDAGGNDALVAAMPDVYGSSNKLVEAVERIKILEAAIRQHRDERGDDRCHADDGRLYAVLPEGDTRPARETAVTIENCTKYIECRQTGREYISPQRRIAELEAEIKRISMITDKEKELAKKIGQFYLQKNSGNYEEAAAEIKSLHISKLFLNGDKLEITTPLPGKVIGRRGRNVEALSLWLSTEIKIIEEKDALLYLLLPEPEYPDDHGS